MIAQSVYLIEIYIAYLHNLMYNFYFNKKFQKYNVFPFLHIYPKRGVTQYNTNLNHWSSMISRDLINCQA